jgi:hypothetical protein
MLLIYSYIFTFPDSVKAILVHRANRLLLESTLILRTLREQGRMARSRLVAQPLQPHCSDQRVAAFCFARNRKP